MGLYEVIRLPQVHQCINSNLYSWIKTSDFGIEINMKTKLVATVIKLILIVCFQCVLSNNESILIIALPQTVNSELLTWERGQEILPGALAAAADVINNDSGILPLKLVMADSGPVTRYNHPYSGNVLEVIAKLTWQNKSVDIIGIAGILHPDVLRALHKFRLPVISLIQLSRIPDSTCVNYATSSISVITDSVLAFVAAINQSRIGLVTELHNSYFFNIANDLYAKTKADAHISIELYVQIGGKFLISHIINNIVDTNVRVILLSVPPSVSMQILHEAYKKHLVWPSYTWILYSFQLDGFHQSITDSSIQNIFDGIILILLFPNKPLLFTQTEPCWTHQNNTEWHTQTSQDLNSFAYLLQDAVYTLILRAYNKYYNVSDECSNLIYFYQLKNGTLNPVCTYNGRSRALSSISQNFSGSKLVLPIVSRDSPFSYYTMVPPSLCIVTNTIILILYLCFRNKPSVKSTSVSLSLLMFLGCYLLAIYAIVLIIDESYNVEPLWLDCCMILIWLSGIGLSLPLILSTLLVKMLQVYHIITLNRILKRKVYTSSCAHFVYTLLVMLPNILILLLWTIIDTRRDNIQYVEHPGYIAAKSECKSNNREVWLLLMLAYNIMLSLTVVIVAVKSRKIRLKQFKDTKKVNLLIFLILVIGISTFSYWLIFALANTYFEVSIYILYTGHIVISFLCQIILFVPKVWPPVHEKIFLHKLNIPVLHSTM